MSDQFLDNMFQQHIPQKELPVMQDYPAFYDQEWRTMPPKGNLGPQGQMAPQPHSFGGATPAPSGVDRLSFLKWLLMKLQKGPDAPDQHMDQQLQQQIQQQQQPRQPAQRYWPQT